VSKTPRKPPLALDMDFSEALKRFANVDPIELPQKKSETKAKQGARHNPKAGQ